MLTQKQTLLLIESGEIKVATGKAADAVRLFDSFDRYDSAKADVVPRASLVQDHM